MSQFTCRLAGLLVMIACCYPGCEAPLPPTPTNEPMSGAAAWAEWQQLSHGEQAGWDIDRAATLTSIMAGAPTGLTPLLEAFGDGATPAHVKVLGLICLTPIREQLLPYESTIAPLTETTQPQAVRTFGAHLLGLIDSASAVARVTALLDDPDRAVREAAIGVLVTVHGEAVASRVEAIWNDPETTGAIKEQIVLGMAPELVEGFLSVFADAVLDHQLAAGARYKAATVLGQTGDETHIAILEQAVETDPDPYVRERAQGGLAMLRSSAGAPASGSPPSQ